MQFSMVRGQVLPPYKSDYNGISVLKYTKGNYYGKRTYRGSGDVSK
jgi:hypothetical protein